MSYEFLVCFLVILTKDVLLFKDLKPNLKFVCNLILSKLTRILN